MTPLDGRFFIANERLASAGERSLSKTRPLSNPSARLFLASSADCRGAIEAAKKAYPLWRNITTEQKRRLFLKAKAVLLRPGDGDRAAPRCREGHASRRVADQRGVLDYRDPGLLWPEPEKNVGAQEGQGSISRCSLNKRTASLFQPLGPYARHLALELSVYDPFFRRYQGTHRRQHGRPAAIDVHALAGLAIGEIITEAGVPAGVLNIVPCRVPQAEEMIVDPDIQSIAFTGSVGVGKRILELASRNLTNVVLELGGKDPDDCFPRRRH